MLNCQRVIRPSTISYHVYWFSCTLRLSASRWSSSDGIWLSCGTSGCGTGSWEWLRKFQVWMIWGTPILGNHIITQIVPSRKNRSRHAQFRDEKIVEDSRKQYSFLGIPTSSKKAFSKEPKYVAWGTEVDNKTGRVGTPLLKLRHLSAVINSACGLPKVTKKLMQGLTGLLVHPFLHRRLAMSILQDTYLWIEKMDNNESKTMPAKVREELLGCALILPLCHSNIRWNVSKRIGASDASLQHGGRAAALVNQSTANTLYRFSEHRGEHIRLDWEKGAVQPISQMERAPPELEQIVQDLPWNQTESIHFSHQQHINILEAKMIYRELRDIVMQSGQPLRNVLLVDSRAAAGAWSKGRSSAKNLNRVLRQSLGWSLVGRKSIHLIWVRSEANPADFPSRKLRIPPPSKEASEFTRLALGDQLDSCRCRRSNREIWRAVNRSENVEHNPVRARTGDSSVGDCMNLQTNRSSTFCRDEAQKHPSAKTWTFREVFAGSAHLTKTMRSRKVFKVGNPVEVFSKGRYDKSCDILHDETFDRLCREACEPRQYWHFGFPCGSFSLMQNMNHGTRTAERPLGDGTLEREKRGNEILHRTIHLCRLLHEHGSFFSLENPKSSYAWKIPTMCDLLKSCGCEKVNFDQCQYGLKIPISEHVLGLALKPTTIAGTLPGLKTLERKCAHDHTHVAVLGGVKFHGRWRRRSELAGAYPSQLCHQIAKTFEKAFA